MEFSISFYQTITTLVTLFCLIPKLSAASNSTDKAALLAFKSALSDPFGGLSSWNDSVHFCKWYGVTCGKLHNERVIILELSGLQLEGPISPAIANLTFLRQIILNQNRLTGPIIDEFFSMPRLRVIWLGKNFLEGEIPASFTNSTSLRTVSFVNNLLTGEIPRDIGKNTIIRALSIGMNNLTGTIPDSVCNMSSLVGFYMQKNRLEGSIPDCIGQLPNFAKIQAYDNSLSGSLPVSLYNLSSMQIISLGNNRLTGRLPPDMFNSFPYLELLLLSGNQFYGPLPVSLSNATNMADLELSENRFTGMIPPDLGGLQQLWWMELSNNQLEAKQASDWEFMTSLANCSSLQLLGIQNNSLGGVLPESLGKLAPHIDTLAIGMNRISGEIPEGIGNLINLTTLLMNDNYLTGKIPATIGRLQRLHWLRLEGNNLSGEIPSTIGNISQLNEVHLQSNSLNGSIPESFGNFRSLEEVDLSHNKLSGSIPRKLLMLSSLSKKLNLSSNQLSGHLPLEIGNLKNLGTFDVSDNQLSGEVPRSLGDCQSLEYLYMQGNFFNGSIPESLSNLKGLQVLDLSGNRLSGKIPESFETLQDLQLLNLSFNDLEGQVPEKGVLENTTALSLEGNQGLCGGPEKLHLLQCSSQVKTSRKLKSKVLKIAISTLSALFVIISLATLGTLYWMKHSKKRTSFKYPFEDQFVKISYNELLKATNGFSASNLIGMGTFGSVYKANGICNEEIVAVKVLNLQVKGASRSFMAECEALGQIRHRNLVKIVTSCSSADFNGDDFKALVLQYMRNGNLHRWLHPEVPQQSQTTPLTLLHRLNIAVDVACALDYLHHHGHTPIVHCDLKPSNVLLNETMCAHVSDFGLARIINNAYTGFKGGTLSTGIRGTIGYVPPEYGMGGQVSTHGDVYSYGILLLELFTGKRPTEEIFKEGLHLSKYVEMAIPDNILDVLDANMFRPENKEQDRNKPEEKPNLEEELNCLISVFKIALSCCKDDPRERVDMQDVLKEILAIRAMFLKVTDR